MEAACEAARQAHWQVAAVGDRRRLILQTAASPKRIFASVLALTIMAEDREPGEVTQLLHRWSASEEDAGERLLAVVYDELRRLAAAALRRERQEHTLQPTALVHEAFLKLVAAPVPSFEDRRHFFGVAARAMRQLLVDHARTHARQKRPDPALRMPFEVLDTLSVDAGGSEEILAVHQALDRLAAKHQRYARVVELRYFGGFSLPETAEVLGTSRATVARDWTLARALLLDFLDDGGRDA